jgi:GTP-binding protein LepA
MDIERERGITIKSQTVCLPYKSRNGDEYILNMIDTPGHVDFSYEVSRALASCEGILLLVDASQGVEAQTVANLYAALEHNLTIIPVINKIDLPTANIPRVREEIETELGLDSSDAILCSAKEGIGIEDVMEAVVERIPPHHGDASKSLKALIFDAHYDSFRGAIISCRVFDGSVKADDEIKLVSFESVHTVEEVGVFRLEREKCDKLSAGEVGYIIAGVKTVSDTRVGDTIVLASDSSPELLPGFKEVKPMVFSSIYPVERSDVGILTEAIEKYKLNDAALVYQKDSSAALGQGFRCGFLGLLHLEIFQQRLDREFNIPVIMTAPSVRYKFILNSGESVTIENPQYYPDPFEIQESLEPIVRASILLPEEYMGVVMKLCLNRRGENPRISYPVPGRLEIIIDMPLAEIIYDFYDRLKSITRGYGTFDYDFLKYQKEDLVKVYFLVNGERVDALSIVVHRERARQRAVQICDSLKKEIPRHMFKIAIQGAIGGEIISRSTVSAFRKDVTAKCYGGDITRKRKLLSKQAAGKKKMKMIGKVMIPQSAFISVLKTNED